MKVHIWPFGLLDLQWRLKVSMVLLEKESRKRMNLPKNDLRSYKYVLQTPERNF